MTPLVEGLIALLGPVAAALILASLPGLRRRGWPAAFLCIAASVLSTVLAVHIVVGQWGGAGPVEAVTTWLSSDARAVAQVGVRLDGASASMLAVVCFVALCVQLFSLGYMHDEEPAGFGRYF